MAGRLDIGGVAEQGENALVAKLAEAHEVDHAARDGRDVDLEVAGMHDGAHRGPDRQRDGIRDAVVDVDQLNVKATQLDMVARVLFDQLSGR